MIATAEEYAGHRQGEERQQDGIWCYLAVLRGQLYAIPDEPHAILMPHIGRLGQLTPLPLGLVPPYVLGLVNVNGSGELLIDLGAYLGLTGEAGSDEGRRMLVIGEGGVGDDRYRLAFTVDGGHELTQVDPGMRSDENGSLVRQLVDTRLGQAALLDMAAVCSAIVRDLGAERPWTIPPRPSL